MPESLLGTQVSTVSCWEQISHEHKHVPSRSGSSLLPLGKRERHLISQPRQACSRPSLLPRGEPGCVRRCISRWIQQLLAGPVPPLHNCSGAVRAGASRIQPLASRSGGRACGEQSDSSRNAVLTRLASLQGSQLKDGKAASPWPCFSGSPKWPCDTAEMSARSGTLRKGLGLLR